MKSLIAFAIILLAVSAHADQPMTCTYHPTAAVPETLPLAADTLYVDVESKTNSFMLLGKESDNLVQEAEQMITERKIDAGTVYMFERFDADSSKLSFFVSPIVGGQVTGANPESLDFDSVASITAQGQPLTLKAAPGVTCALGAPASTAKKIGDRLPAMQCDVDSQCLIGQSCMGGQCSDNGGL